jgi:hypothetical protein
MDFGEILWLYQTLIAGVLAVVAAVGTAIALAVQIREQRVQFNERKKSETLRAFEAVHERVFVSAQMAFYKLTNIGNLCNKYTAQIEELGIKEGAYSPFPRDTFFDREEIYAIFICGEPLVWEARRIMTSMDMFNESLSFPGDDDRRDTFLDLLEEILTRAQKLMDPLAMLPPPLHASRLSRAVQEQLRAAGKQ